MLAHSNARGIALKTLEVRTGLGSEFDGDTVHYRPDGFHGSITATRRYPPLQPARPNANANVESSRATIELELFDLENFTGKAHFLAAITTCQPYFNFARKNRSRGQHTPAELLALRAPNIDPRALLLRPILSPAQVGQHLSGPPENSG